MPGLSRCVLHVRGHPCIPASGSKVGSLLLVVETSILRARSSFPLYLTGARKAAARQHILVGVHLPRRLYALRLYKTLLFAGRARSRSAIAFLAQASAALVHSWI